jgi:hypothetical protein
MSKFTDFFKGAFNKVGKVVSAPFNLVKKTVTTIVETPFKLVSKVTDTAGGIFKGEFDMVGGVLKSPIMLIGGGLTHRCNIALGGQLDIRIVSFTLKLQLQTTSDKNILNLKSSLGDFY